MLDHREILVLAKTHQYVLGQVDDDRARPAAACHVKCFMHNPGQILHPLNQVVVLGARPRDPGRVRFLEGVIADQMCRNLTGQANNRNTVHQSIGQPGNGVCCAGTRRNKNDTDLSGGPGVTFRHVHSTAFLANENVPKLILLKYRIVNRKHGTAGITEYGVDTLIRQRLNNYLGAVHTLTSHRCSPSSIVKYGRDSQHRATEKSVYGPDLSHPRTYFAMHNQSEAGNYPRYSRGSTENY